MRKCLSLSFTGGWQSGNVFCQMLCTSDYMHSSKAKENSVKASQHNRKDGCFGRDKLQMKPKSCGCHATQCGSFRSEPTGFPSSIWLFSNTGVAFCCVCLIHRDQEAYRQHDHLLWWSCFYSLTSYFPPLLQKSRFLLVLKWKEAKKLPCKLGKERWLF